MGHRRSRIAVAEKLVADGQPLAALGLAPLEYDAAVLGAHPNKEPVRAATATAVGLKSALHDSWGLPARTVVVPANLNRNGPPKRVSIVVDSPAFLSGCRLGSPTLGKACRGSFPHLWKN